MKRYLVCNGDANDLATWSDIPWFTLQAGREAGLLDGGLSLQPERLRGHRRLWNMAQLLRSGKPGGYQYSEGFNRRLLAQARAVADPGAPQWRVDFGIDATTRQAFEACGNGDPFQAAAGRRCGGLGGGQRLFCSDAADQRAQGAAAALQAARPLGQPRNKVHIGYMGSSTHSTGVRGPQNPRQIWKRLRRRNAGKLDANNRFTGWLFGWQHYTSAIFLILSIKCCSSEPASTIAA